MKIDPPSKSTPATAVKQVSTGRAQGKAPSRSQSSVKDDVRLTDQATILGELESQLAGFDATDPALVEAVRAAIREGDFKVNEEKVAENLIKESLDLIHSQVKP